MLGEDANRSGIRNEEMGKAKNAIDGIKGRESAME